MKEYLVTLKGYSYFTSHIYYLAVKANSSLEARSYRYEDEEDGELEVVGVQHLTEELMEDIQSQLNTIQKKQAALPLMDIKRDELEREAYELRQQLDAALDSEFAWA